MNVKKNVTTRPITANLTSVSVAPLGPSLLRFPVFAVLVGRYTALPVWIAYATHSFGICRTGAFYRAKSATARLDHACSCLVQSVASFTLAFNMRLWLSGFQLWLSRGKLGQTLSGAEARLSIRPIIKFSVAPFARKDRSFCGVGTRASVYTIASFRAANIVSFRLAITSNG